MKDVGEQSFQKHARYIFRINLLDLLYDVSDVSTTDLVFIFNFIVLFFHSIEIPQSLLEIQSLSLTPVS